MSTQCRAQTRRPQIAVVDDQLTETKAIIRSAFTEYREYSDEQKTVSEEYFRSAVDDLHKKKQPTFLSEVSLGPNGETEFELSFNNVDFYYTETRKGIFDILLSQDVDVVICDLKLLNDEGLEDSEIGHQVVEEIRRLSDAGILVYTTVEEESAEIRSLRIGADDYVVKRQKDNTLFFRVFSLLRRVRRMSRSERTEQPKPQQFLIGRWQFSVGDRTLISRVSGEKVKLSFKEYDLMYFLCVVSEDHSITKDEFYVWVLHRDAEGKKAHERDRRLDNQISRLRKKLGDAESFRSVHGEGYSLRNVQRI